MKLIRVSTASPLSRRVGGRAASLIPLALAGTLWLSLPAVAALPGNLLVTVPAGTLPTNGRVVPGSGSATIGLPGDPANRMTITQNSQQVIIDWDSFNIGADAIVKFIQPGATAEALNRIFGADPSIILGQLQANGRVYLINSNGIMFGRGAQVDARGLIASSLAMSQPVFENGVFSDATKPALEGTLKLDADGKAMVDTATEPTGAVANQGTIRSVDADGNSAGGYIMLVAPQVENEGVIVADNGQVVLAAGARAWLSPNYAGTKLDITMRGMVVEIQAGSEPVDVSSLVRNAGVLQADRGNVSMVGLLVNQAGTIRAGTAVNQNGSIWLLAREKPGLADRRFGTLDLAKGSVTETPLIEDGTTLTEGQSYEDYRARVKLDGETVAVRGSIVAHGGIVEIGQASAAGTEHNTRRVLLDATASIDVSGSTAELDMAKNFLTFKVTSDDLKDAPIQKNGFLLGKTVTVDVRKGSPELFDISAAAANVKRGIYEKAATGGDVKIAATEVIAKEGATIDVSGGAWRYSGTDLTSTQLRSGNRVYDIHTASTDLVYEDVAESSVDVEHAKWGITKHHDSQILARTATNGGYSYVEGRDAGSVSLNAASISLGSGTLKAATTAGQNQRNADTIPTGAKLVLGDDSGSTAAVPDFRLGDVTFGREWGSAAADFDIDDPLPADEAVTTSIASDVFGSGSVGVGGEYRRTGFAKVEVYANGKVEVAAGGAIDAPAGSSLKVDAHAVAVNDDIRLPSGSVSLNAQATAGSSGEAGVTVAAGKTISAAGQWVNDSPATSAAGHVPRLTDGGSIKITGYNIDLGADSLLDVSAGARLDSAYKLTAGKGGSISLLLEEDKNNAGSLAAFGRLVMNGRLHGHGINGGQGGSLTVQAASATIGGSARNDRDLVLDPSLFRQGGFTSYTVTGWYDAEVAAGTTVRPVAETRVVDTVQGSLQATGSEMAGFSETILPPVYQRHATDLTLASGFAPVTSGESAPAAVGATGGVHVATGAVIETDPGATVTLSSKSYLEVDGTISTPGGTINLELMKSDKSQVYGGSQLRIGSDAKLIAAGTYVPQPNADGWLQGELLRGGTIRFDVSKNDLVVEAGALIDVSGASAVKDIATDGTTLYTRQTVGSEGGSIEIKATENVRLDGTLKAEGGVGAAGGNFSLTLKYHEDESSSNDPALQNSRHVIAVRQGRDEAIAAETDTVKAEVSADMLEQGGFGKVTLSAEDAIEFQGAVDLAMKRALVLDAPEIAAIDGATVTLAAGQVNLQNTPASYRPSGGFAGVATRTGTGTLAVDGDLVELAGHVTLNGFADTRLTSSGDLRAAGFSVTKASADEALTKNRLTGSLTTPGDLTLTAAQVYPSTSVDYKIRVADVAADGTATTATGRTLRIEGNDNAPGTLLSAGGKLRFEADSIVQDGVVKAPLGALEFVAASKLLVTDRSLTSVSANGLTIPFGITENGESLYFGAVDRTATPPEKRIVFEAPDEEIAPAAQIDIGGGGDLQAVEWVPGLGGSKDVLLADGTWAIVPGLRFASRDAMLEGLKSLGFDTASAIYDSVYLSSGSGLPAGYYPLLPGYYALLPGAYVVTRPTASTAMADMIPNRTAKLANGQTVVAGRFASAASGETETTWSGFVVRSGTEVLKEAEYRISDSSFYAEAATAAERAVPQLPADAGRVAFVATNSLALGGVLNSLPADGGRIGEVDIAAPNLAVVSQAGTGSVPAGFVEIEAERLSGFNASVMLGGTRSSTTDGTAVDVVASEVRVANDDQHALTAPEVILAAKDRVEVSAGSVVEARGSSATSGKDLIVSADDAGGALLHLSAGAPVAVLRGAGRGANRGELEVAEGAVLRTSRSLLLDATTTTRSFGTLDIAAGGSASFSALKVSLGETPLDADGLVMDRAQLEAMAGLGELTLKSYSNIDLYGNASFGDAARGSLTLDAAGIVGHAVDGRNDATLAARTLVLQNSGTATADLVTGDSGTLTLAGQGVIIGAGKKTLAGFAAVKLAASGQMEVQGEGSLKSAGDLTLEAARITVQGKSNQTIQAGDDTSFGWRNVTISRPANAATITAQAAAGGQLGIIGKRVEHGGNIEMPSGVLTLGARGSDAGDDVVLLDGSRIVASGYARDFAGTTVAASGGKVVLESDHGSVEMAAGASLDVSGTSGSDAGKLVVHAIEGEAHLNGMLSGGATGGGDAGSVTLDVGSLANFSELNAGLKAGGFGNEYSVRARNGDVAIAAGDTVVARDFELVADHGSIDVAGTVDASGATGGGRIVLTAKNDLNLRAGSVLDARGTSAATGAADAYSHGGEVEVATVDGRLDFAEGATIDVSAAAGGKSDGGEVLFSAARTVRGDGTPGVNMNLAGTVKVSGGDTPGSAGSVIVEGRKTYTGVTNTSAYVTPGVDANNPVWNDYQAYMNNVAAIRADLALKNADGSAFDTTALRVRAGIELQSDGDMAHTAGWNLVQGDWRIGDEAGRLTLRAAGNLTISNYLGFPNDTLPTGETWSLRLVGGGDLSSANALATIASTNRGDVTLATTTARVTSGTGDIDIAAGRDFKIATLSGTKAAVYTAGTSAVFDTSNGNAAGTALNRFTENGGDIRIRAEGSVTGVAGDTSPNVWLRRLTSAQVAPGGNYMALEGLWWADRSKFTQGVGVLGGGDLSVTAESGNVTNLVAVVATAGRDLDKIKNSTNGTLLVYGGGDMTIAAGGDVVGGSYLLGRGQASISAGGNFGAANATTKLYVMGESDDEALRAASVKVEALGDLWLTSASNPTVLAMTTGSGTNPGTGGNASKFFTYAPDSALALVSVAGDVSPVAAGLSSNANLTESQVYPPSVTVAALQGDVVSTVKLSGDSTAQWAALGSANGSVNILAAGDISNQRALFADGLMSIDTMGRASTVNYWNSKQFDTFNNPTSNNLLGILDKPTTRAVTHADDDAYHYKVVALDGDISESKFEFSQKGLVQAGGNIANLVLDAQNLADDDVTVVRAGGNLYYTNATRGSQERIAASNAYLRIGGPGRMLVQAGGDIDFSQAAGVFAVGNSDNTSLTGDRSAVLTVLAGVKDEVAQADIDALFGKLREFGVKKDIAGADAAIAALFGTPESGSGDLKMVYAGIQTQGDSAIQVLAPHGRIDVGLPTALADTTRQIGIVTAAGGSIDVLVRDDILVNLSKVITMLGGDVTIYAQKGDIDAGRGPRDSVSSLGPESVAINTVNAKGVSVDSGLRRFRPSIDAAGSGIRTVSFDPDGVGGPMVQPTPGAIYLIAPSGTIDAGEAGVNAAGNLFVVAQTVLNSANFSAGGSSSGVPVSDAGSLAGALSSASGSTAGTSKAIENAAGQGSTQTDAFHPSFIDVEVLGIGE